MKVIAPIVDDEDPVPSHLDRRLFFLLVATLLWSTAMLLEASRISSPDFRAPAGCYFSGKVQEAFLKVFQKLDQFKGNSKFSTWLIRIVLNETFMKLRKRRFSDVPLESEDSDGNVLPMDLTDWSPNPEELCGRKELREILRTALESLPQSLRVVFVLRDIEELSINETAAVLGLNPAGVKARHFRARLQLREKLTRHFKLSSILANNSVRL